MEELMRLFDFNLADLETNKQGYMSDLQKRKYREIVWHGIGPATISLCLYGCIFWAIFAATMIGWGIVHHLINPKNAILSGLEAPLSILGVGIFISMFIFFLIVIGMRAFTSRQVNQAINKGVVGRIVGKAHLSTKTVRGFALRLLKIEAVISSVLIIGGFEFTTTEDQYTALKEGEYYAVYYSPFTYHIFSIEKLD